MKTISIARDRHLADDPGTGHNRWHPDIEPLVEVDEGDEVALETRDAVDGYLTPQSSVQDVGGLNVGAIHPLTGPVFVKGAHPGDMLEIEFVDIVPQQWAFSAIVPGLGFLRDVMTAPFLAQWDLADGHATSEQIPGIRLPGNPFMGVSGVAPSHAEVETWSQREADLLARGGVV